MTLGLALTNAITSLRLNQSAITLLSQNIANVNTDGYTRKTIDQSAVYLNGVGAGVQVDGIDRKVSEYLQTSLREQNAVVGRNEIEFDYLERIQRLLGEPGTGTDISSYINDFFNAAQDLSNSPDKLSVRELAVDAGVRLADTLSTLAGELEALRFDADKTAYQTANEINFKLEQLFNTNVALQKATAFKTDTVGLLDERDKLLEELSSLIPIDVREGEAGVVTITTEGGYVLLDKSIQYRLYMTPSTSVELFINNTPPPPIYILPYTTDDGLGALSEGEILYAEGTEGSINTLQDKGKLRGLIQMRDIEIPKILAELDELANALRNGINAVHNGGTGFPPPTELQGTRPLTITDRRDWQGEVRIGIVNLDGTPVQSPYVSEQTIDNGVRPLTLNLGGLDLGNGVGQWTNEDIVDEINAYFSIPQKKIHVGDLHDIRLVSLTENNPAGVDFSFDFDFESLASDQISIDVTGIAVVGGVLTSPLPGMYNLDSGEKTRTGAAFSFDVNGAGPFTISVDITVTNVDGSTDTATIEFTVDNSSTDMKNDRYIGNVTAGTGIEELPAGGTALATARLVNSAGNTATTIQDAFLSLTTENGQYGISIDELNSVENGLLGDLPPIIGTGRGFSHYFELNDFFVRNEDEELTNSAINMAVREDIANNSHLMATGKLTISNQPASPDAIPIFTYELGNAGDQSIKAMAALANAIMTFGAAGSLPASGITLNGYASALLGANATQAIFAKQSYEQSTLMQEGVMARKDAVSGVNLDEEMANTIIFQNAYTASTRVITVTDELFQELLNAVV